METTDTLTKVNEKLAEREQVVFATQRAGETRYDLCNIVRLHSIPDLQVFARQLDATGGTNDQAR